MWALIQNGTVAEITNIDPKGRFHPSLQWEPADETVEVGDIYDGQAYSRPVESLEDLAARIRSTLEAERQATEATGVTLNGIRYEGDPSNRQALNEALQFAVDAGVETFQRWKDSDGNFHLDLPVSEVEDALRAIAARRSQLIEREGELVAQVIAAQEIGDREALSSIVW